MDVLTGEQVARLLKHMVVPEVQVRAESVDLTVKSVSRVATTGAVDFAGIEFLPGERVALIPKPSRPTDKHGWWLLAAGEFLVEYNEELTLPPHHLAIIQAHGRLMETGVTHTTRFITETEQALFSIIHVCQADVRIQENARISELIVLQH
jgi:deoxycytidine triphosphate deaminase